MKLLLLSLACGVLLLTYRKIHPEIFVFFTEHESVLRISALPRISVWYLDQPLSYCITKCPSQVRLGWVRLGLASMISVVAYG